MKLILFLLPLASSYMLADVLQASLLRLISTEIGNRTLSQDDLYRLQFLWGSATNLVLEKGLPREKMDTMVRWIVSSHLNVSADSLSPILQKRKDYIIAKVLEIDTDARYFGVDGKELLGKVLPYGFSQNFTQDSNIQRGIKIEEFMYNSTLLPGAQKMREIAEVLLMPLSIRNQKEEMAGYYCADSFNIATDGNRILALAGLSDEEKVNKLVSRIEEKNLWTDIWNMGYDKKEFARRFIRQGSPIMITVNTTDEEFDKMTTQEKVKLMWKIERETYYVPDYFE